MVSDGAQIFHLADEPQRKVFVGFGYISNITGLMRLKRAGTRYADVLFKVIYLRKEEE